MRVCVVLLLPTLARFLSGLGILKEHFVSLLLIIFVLVARQVFMQKTSTAQLTTFMRNKKFLITFDILQCNVDYVASDFSM